MKTLVLLSLLALPLSAEVRLGVRGGAVSSALTGTVELEAGAGRWSVAPAYGIVAGGYGQTVFHGDVRRRFSWHDHPIWIGAGPTWVRTTDGSRTTYNVDFAYGWTHGPWETFAGLRYYRYRIPVFRDVIDIHGPELSFGISRRLTR